MNFLQSPLLYALPLALLPIIIHLINQHRHRTVEWAAMMFLLDAKKMTKGVARVRQILILSMRVLAILALIFAAARPLATGWIALTAGGKADTVIVLLDRSASMEQQNLETGKSKRSTALAKLSDMLAKTARGSRLVLIESANLEVVELSKAEDLLDLPATAPTDTHTDIPSLLQAALDLVAADASGRTDIWLASDSRVTDWRPSDGRWDALRSTYSELEGINFYLLNYPEVESDNLAVSVSNLVRRRGNDGMELVMDLSILRQSGADRPQTVPVELTINGARTATTFDINSDSLNLQGHTISLGNSEATGWGRIDLPADGNDRDNTAFFVFDKAPVLKTVIVSDDTQTAGSIRAAATASVDTSRVYTAEIIPTSRQAEVPWGETALLFWQAPLPQAESPEAGLLRQFVADGKSLVLLPPTDGIGNDSAAFFDFRWKDAGDAHEKGDFKVGWWRTDSGLLANTQNGKPLPLAATKIFRVSEFEGEIQPFLKIEDGRTVIARHTNNLPGSVYIWATLPRASHSSLASDGVAFFAMIHRALDIGGNFLSDAQLRSTGWDLPETNASPWQQVSGRDSTTDAIGPSLCGGAFQSDDRWLALNRPKQEDDLRVLSNEAFADLFTGLEFRVIKDSIDNRSALAAEIWRAFLIAMALALVIEAALCLPPKQEPETVSVL